MVSRHVGAHDIGGKVRFGPVTAKRLELALRVPLLVDVDPTGLQWVRRDDEVSAARRAPSLHDRFPGGSEERLPSLR